MRVIMLQDVGGVGQRGKIIEVSDGYALNLLIPQGKAIQATPEKEVEVMKRLASEGVARREQEAELTRAIQSLENAEVRITAKASEKGGLFKAITGADVAKAIAEQKSVRIPLDAILLEKPIKEVGEHVVPIKKDKAASKMRLVVVAA